MLFVTYWELNEGMSQKEKIDVAMRLAALHDDSTRKSVRWDITPDNWGVSIFEAETAADVIGLFDMWRAAAPGFFKLTKTAPAMTVEESMELGAANLKMLGG